MKDADVLAQINRLAEEEKELENDGPGGPSEEARQRLREIEVALDQCWDLLRQRRARRKAGLDPDDADARPEQVVEHYQQ